MLKAPPFPSGLCRVNLHPSSEPGYNLYQLRPLERPGGPACFTWRNFLLSNCHFEVDEGERTRGTAEMVFTEHAFVIGVAHLEPAPDLFADPSQQHAKIVYAPREAWPFRYLNAPVYAASVLWAFPTGLYVLET